ncbi:hypothetical protein [Nocardia sp. NPDC004415]
MTAPQDQPLGSGGMRALVNERQRNRELRAEVQREAADAQELRDQIKKMRDEREEYRRAVRLVVDDAYSETGGWCSDEHK